jgi:DNA modification methylase
VKPYYEEPGITIFNCDFRDVFDSICADVLVTDPPYGIRFSSGKKGRLGDCSINGDLDTVARDTLLDAWGERPALVFGTWKIARPINTRHLLIWEKGEHVGMGDLSLPWKPNHEEIYVIGRGFFGRRRGSVLRHLAVAGCVGRRKSRWHPMEKPVSLMMDLISCCHRGVILDPFAGSGTTLVAAKALGYRAVGIEIEEAHCRSAMQRLAQGVLAM